ncbi:MAG: NifB/NifX family molybdenum-iron cluster-binding protein [Anaerolineae bacterium]
MRIAVSADNAQGLESIAAHHFGRCPYYVFVDLDGHEIKNVETLRNPYYEDHRPGAVPQLIHEHGVDVMLAGGMGRRAITLFERYGIETYTGASGTVRRAIEQYLGGTLEDARPCKEHSGGDHDHGHDDEHGEIRRLREEVAALHKQIAEAGERLDALS